MNKQDFLQAQVIQLRNLLEEAGDDPVLAPQLKYRLEDAEARLEDARRESGRLLPRENIVLPRAAIFIKTVGMASIDGIRPSLAGQALIQYEGMFVEQALHDEREAAKASGRQRRPRGAPKPELLLVGTPRGSFGLEFVAQVTEGDAQLRRHAQSLENIALALQIVADAEPTELERTLRRIPHGLIPYLTRFFKVLADHEAELYLAFPQQRPVAIELAKVKATAERLDRDIRMEVVKVNGIFRGLTRDSGYFDLRKEDGVTITGMLAEELSEEDIETIASLANSRCVATIEQTTVSSVAGSVSHTYLLIDAAAAS